jgi:single-strand DNA-binding protein
MNKIFIIGNLCRDPELRSTQAGIPVCTFTVAVNRRKAGAEAGQPEADFFRVTTWRQTAENCQRFLAKGRKVAVTGAVSLNTYTAKDGTTKASLEVNADEVEFLTPKTADAPPAPEQTNAWAGFVPVDDAELPF